MVIPGNASETGTDFISIGESGCAAFTGCTDSVADNYSEVYVISDNTLCEYSVVPGCMDMTACNYNADAGQDDGSCEYPAEGYDCEGNCLEGVNAPFNMESTYYSDGFYGATYTITNTSTGETVANGPSDAGYWTYSTDDYCMPAGCYEVNVTSNSAMMLMVTIGTLEMLVVQQAHLVLPTLAVRVFVLQDVQIL